MQTVSTPVPARTQPGKLLELDEDLFTAYFDRYPFKISHNLCAHPLLQLPRLIELARSLGHPILYFKGDQAINQVDDGSGEKRTFVDRNLTRPDLSAVETLAQIESCRAWMQLRDVGADPQYAALLDTIIEEFRGPSERVAAGLSAPRADIFVSSPGATTPFHLDEEHNFLLQIRGSKKLSIADGFNPAVLQPERLRAYFHGSGELAPYSAHLEQHAVHVDLAPGEGVHIPPCHPHWVQNGNEVSISLGILWFSDVTARRRHLYRVNGWLERAGLHPSMPGTRALGDSVKALPLVMKRRLRRWMRQERV
ncbi:MAG: cupin-like domain-containing protein [Steroidobacteraceae bacterium]